MRKVLYVLCLSVITFGCADPDPKNTFNAVVTFPVNNQCHDYVAQLPASNSYEMSYKPFTIELDAFPQISGFMELRSNNMMNVELQNEAIKVMDNCFARAMTSVDISTPEGWLHAGRVVQSNTVNGVPIHSLVLDGSKLNIHYNWQDKKESLEGKTQE